MAITGINNSSYTSYYASNYKNTVKKTDSEKDSTNTKDVKNVPLMRKRICKVLFFNRLKTSGFGSSERLEQKSGNVRALF